VKITEAAQIIGQICPWEKLCSKFSQKNGLGHVLGEFFTNASGHTGTQEETSVEQPDNKTV
jgi:hypothetical protein